MAEDKKDEKAPVEAPQASGKNPIVTVLLLVNAIALGVVAFMQYKFMEMESKRPDLTQLLKESQEAASAEAVAEQKPVEAVKKENLVSLDGFTINLAQGDGPRRFVRLNAVLKMSDESKMDEVEARKPQIRDTIISILNAKRPEDLLKKEGKAYLKEEIKAAINAYMIDGKIVDVFYIGFQIN
jgi:flagellar FliL protein